MPAERSLVYEFVSEAKEHLANVTDDLLALEKVPLDAIRYRIDRLFRSMHSVKGGAGFFAFHNITELAHLMETLLKRLRELSVRPDERQLDALLAGSDLILTLLDDVERSSSVDISPVRDRLQSLVSGALATLTAASQALQVRGPTDAALATAAQPPLLYAIHFDLGEHCRSRQQPPLAFLKTLLTFGSVLEARLETDAVDLHQGLPTGPVIYRAMYATTLDLEQIRDLTGLARGQIVPVPLAEQGGPVSGEHAVVLSRPAGEAVTAGEPGRKDSLATSLRINVALLDRLMNLAGELVLVRNQALLAVETSDVTVRRIMQKLNTVTSELQDVVMKTRMQPVSNLFNKFPRLVRDLARGLGKSIELTIEGNEVELDKSILETLSDPLTHLIRNCCDHGIEQPMQRLQAGKPETGRILLRAHHEGSQILIEIRDDGRGIDPERIRRKALEMGLKSAAELAGMGSREILTLILLPGFTTAERVTDLSGRGVGMNVVQNNIELLGGLLEIESVVGQGTTIHLRLPLTVAIIPCSARRRRRQPLCHPTKRSRRSWSASIPASPAARSNRPTIRKSIACASGCCRWFGWRKSCTAASPSRPRIG